MEFEFSYMQTVNERYNSDMNKNALAIVEDAGFEITEFGGGSMLTDDLDALCADCQIGFKASREEAEALKPKIEAIVGRNVELYDVNW